MHSNVGLGCDCCHADRRPLLRTDSLWEYFASLKGGGRVGNFLQDTWLPWLHDVCLQYGNHSSWYWWGNSTINLNSQSCNMKSKQDCC